MYCKYCGNEIVDKSIFCNMCGKRQTVQKEKTETNSKAELKSNHSSNSFKIILIYLVLGLSYFVSWIKLSGASGKIAEFLMTVFGLDIKEISPRLVVDALDYIRELYLAASKTVPINYYLLYLLIFIPILAAIGILFTLAKRPLAAYIGRLTAFVSLVCEAYAWYLATQANIGATVWLYLFTGVSIYFFFILRGYSDSFEMVKEDDNYEADLIEPESDIIPEINKKMKTKTKNGSGKSLRDKRGAESDRCSSCGADLYGETKLCPVCGRNLNR